MIKKLFSTILILLFAANLAFADPSAHPVLDMAYDIGFEDAPDYYTATDVEAALLELITAHPEILSDLTIAKSLFVNAAASDAEDLIFGNPAGNFLGVRITDLTHIFPGAYVPTIYGMSLYGVAPLEIFGIKNGIYVMADGVSTDDPIITLYTANLGNLVNIFLDESENRLYFDQNGNWACFDDEVRIGTNTVIGPEGILHVDVNSTDGVVFEDDNNGNLSGHLELRHDSSSAAVNDFNFTIDFQGDNDGGTEFNYDSIVSQIGAVAAGAESSIFTIKGYAGGTTKEYFVYKGEDATLYLGADGLVNVENDFKVDGASTFNDDVDIADHIRSATSIYRRYYYLPIASFSPGTSGATWTSADANGTGGWQLNTAGETLEGDVDVHTDWDAASDLEIELYFQINTAANANDTVDLKVVLYYMSPGDSATKTQTVEVATNVGGVGGAAQYTMYKTEFVINYDEVDNVVDAGDIIGFQINLETDTSEVDDIIMNHATFHYSTTHVGIEDGDV